MSTDARTAANQANATLSTGPRTDEGKASSSRNNLRHGFRSQSESVLLPGDDPLEYRALLIDLTAHFVPRDITDHRFIREMADAEWRLRRVREYLRLAMNAAIESLSADPDLADLDPLELQRLAIEVLNSGGHTSYSTWLRYESKFERQYERAHRGWQAYQKVCRAADTLTFDDLDRLTAPPPPATQTAVGSNVQNHEPHPATLPETPRSATCPCGSGEKYKRCCGKDAPPVLSQAA